MHAPLFWKDTNRLSNALLPAAGLYGLIAHWRQKTVAPHKAARPVICIGNVLAGGSGKTPVALAIGAMLKAEGVNAHYLMRGYGGSFKGPVRVDPSLHGVREVGDESLLLAQRLPTWVSADRVQGADAAVAAGAQLIVMDDGFQNPSLHKDLALLVIDGAYGFGNGRLLPAGPLRERPEEAMVRAHAVVLMGEDRHGLSQRIPGNLPLLRAKITPVLAPDTLRDVPVVAFAGIARPRKFHRTLQELGARVQRMVAYPDHYTFREKDFIFLRRKAKELGAKLVTTSKDYVRLSPAMQADVREVEIEAVFEQPETLKSLIFNLISSI